MAKCLMTGMEGAFVNSHLIPQAFIRRVGSAPFKELSSDGATPKKRYTGWYDSNIVTRHGENILSALDDYAAKVFYERGFTYRKRRLAVDLNTISGGFKPNKIYSIADVDALKLRKFGLSLLWRAAVSSNSAVSRIQLPPRILENVRSRILFDIDNIFEFPVYFSFASDGQELCKMAPFRVGNHPFIRFFLDGVVCYVSPWIKKTDFKLYDWLFAGRYQHQIKLWCFDSDTSNHAKTDEEIAQST